MDEIAVRKVRASSVGRNAWVLAPIHEIYEDDFANLPSDKDILISPKTPRNITQHAMAWCLAQKVAEACDWLPDKSSAMDWLKIKARHVTMLQDPRTGKVAIIPKSIAFASLGQAAFSRVLNRMVWVTCNEIIPGLEEGSLRKELEAMTTDKRGQR